MVCLRFPPFRAAADQQASLHADRRRTQGGTVDYAAWWGFLSALHSCTSVGPIRKFARWDSIRSTWVFYRPEIYLLRPVLEHLRDNAADDAPAAARTADWDADVTEIAGKAKGGLKKRAPEYITHSLVNAMDIFVLGSGEFSWRYNKQVMEVKSAKEALEYHTREAAGGWKDVYIRQFRAAFMTPPTSSRSAPPTSRSPGRRTTRNWWPPSR